jgi:predicted adenylyl cyclase CyaB
MFGLPTVIAMLMMCKKLKSAVEKLLRLKPEIFNGKSEVTMIFAWLLFFMPHLNVEIKAKCEDPNSIRNYLQDHHAKFMGTDDQTDTYFNVSIGRLKLREGIIENNLIYYNRSNQADPKSSHFQLVKLDKPNEVKEILIKSCGIKVIVEKKREIYYIDNVKFHIDYLKGLGSFVEIEAGNILIDKSEKELLEQCNFYLKELGISTKDLIAESYSDLLLSKEKAI